jgi:membrane protein required for colicin V production
MREIPVLRDVIGTSCELGVLTGFVAVFAVALVIVSIFTPLLSGAVQNSAIGPVDQGLGLVFGAARGVLLIAIAFVVYDRVLGGEGGVPQIDTSYTRALFAGIEAQLGAVLPDDAPQWIAGQYERLVGACTPSGEGA